MNMTLQSHTPNFYFFFEKGETHPLLFFVVLIGTGLEGVREVGGMDEEGKGRKTVSGRRSG